MTEPYRLKDAEYFSSDNFITDPIYWSNISWKQAKDSNYRGNFDNTYSYIIGSVVAQNNALWKDPDQLFKFATLLKKITRGKSASSAGQTSPATSAMWKTVTGKSSDTSKADVMLGKHQVSVKGPEARLMSGVKTESLATLHAAFHFVQNKALEKIVNNTEYRRGIETRKLSWDLKL